MLPAATVLKEGYTLSRRCCEVNDFVTVSLEGDSAVWVRCSEKLQFSDTERENIDRRCFQLLETAPLLWVGVVCCCGDASPTFREWISDCEILGGITEGGRESSCEREYMYVVLPMPFLPLPDLLSSRMRSLCSGGGGN